MSQYIEVGEHRLMALGGNQNQSGIPIIFLHGITLSANFWIPNLPAIVRENIPWYSLSLPGHYPDYYQPELLTANMLADILMNAIQKLVGKQPVALVGYSTGGFAALNLAAHFPSEIKGVFCISGFCEGQWHGFLGWLQRRSQNGVMGKLLCKMLCKALTLNQFSYKLGCSINASDRKAYWNAPTLQTTVDAVYPDVIKHNLNNIVNLFEWFADMDISHLLPKIQAPTLILSGDRDPVIPLAQAKFIASQITEAELIVFEGMGHMFFAERSLAYQNLLTSWIIGKKLYIPE
ncbi:alpha/beta hydrolase [Tolypothrix sp. PCC 7910]|uniref:alpha/beta fold hydrolase n=1 Tax=Tolypothrix sp. PCC 7910 TaxID=2099387 RepID=UPI00142782DC|nr:alpha/beta hydrolase [Tolypothrix sp. PCC 7910]QIR36074.1 alpha/beta hydrolase [Tolypothrix sp. PCC 7910]